jgi:hypothetical protein
MVYTGWNPIQDSDFVHSQYSLCRNYKGTWVPCSEGIATHPNSSLEVLLLMSIVKVCATQQVSSAKGAEKKS